MNEKQKSFILYTSYRDAFRALSHDDAYALIDALFEFAESGTIPELPPAAKMAFLFISEQLKRDKEKYEKVCEKRKEAGKKGGRPPKEKNQTKVKKANGFCENQTKVKKADNEYLDDYEYDYVNEINIKDIVEKNSTPLPYQIIIDYLNKKTNSHYRSTAKATQTKINARIKEGATVEDFKAVIDVKTSQWLDDEKMKGFLRPETLFSASHFESYLNEAKRNTQRTNTKQSDIAERLSKETDKHIFKNLTDSGEIDSGEFM